MRLISHLINSIYWLEKKFFCFFFFFLFLTTGISFTLSLSSQLILKNWVLSIHFYRFFSTSQFLTRLNLFLICNLRTKLKKKKRNCRRQSERERAEKSHSIQQFLLFRLFFVVIFAVSFVCCSTKPNEKQKISQRGRRKQDETLVVWNGIWFQIANSIDNDHYFFFFSTQKERHTYTQTHENETKRNSNTIENYIGRGKTK